MTDTSTNPRPDLRPVVRQQLELLMELTHGLIHERGASTSEHFDAICELHSAIESIHSLTKCDWFTRFAAITLSWIEMQRCVLEEQYRCTPYTDEPSAEADQARSPS